MSSDSQYKVEEPDEIQVAKPAGQIQIPEPFEVGIVDGDEIEVVRALADPNWDFRTIDGLRRTTGLPKDRIRAILEKYEGRRLIQRSSIPDVRGRELYALKSDRTTTQDLLAKLRTFVAKSI